jgi:hypothetical protein
VTNIGEEILGNRVTEVSRSTGGKLVDGMIGNRLDLPRMPKQGGESTVLTGRWLKELGRQREEVFLDDYIRGGMRKRMFGKEADPKTIYEQVSVYHKVQKQGESYYVRHQGLVGKNIERGRILDVVDLTDPVSPKIIEVGTTTPSRSEVLRKAEQLSVWEQAKEEAEELMRIGGDGRIYGKLKDGRYVDITDAQYIIPPVEKSYMTPRK